MRRSSVIIYVCMQRTKKNEEAAEAEGPAEGPSDEELKKEVESILDCAGDDFSMKDLLAKLRASHTLQPHTTPLLPNKQHVVPFMIHISAVISWTSSLWQTSRFMPQHWRLPCGWSTVAA